MSNITGNAPWPPNFPGNSTLTFDNNGSVCISGRNAEGNVSSFGCFTPTPGLKLTFGEGAGSGQLVGEKPKDTGTINQPPSTQQLMDSLIQMLQQLVTQIKGNLPIGGKA